MSGEPLITGMAWSTALGTGLDAVWDRLIAGDSGVRPVPSRHELRNELAGALAEPPPGPGPGAAPGPGPGAGPRERQRALTADTIARALDDAGPGARDGDPWLVAGTSYGSHLDDPETRSLYAWAAEAARDTGIARAPVALSTACSSGSDALLVAARLIRSGAAERVVCGGADVLTDAKRLGHSRLGTMSPTLLRALDTRRDGTLLGEGAAFLVLESAEAARRRGARAYAVLRGAGSSNDAAGMTAPDPSGDTVVQAIGSALADAGARWEDVGVVNAHGSGTEANDDVETRSLGRLAEGGHRPTVFATKGAFGHTLGATGAMEAVAVVLALKHRRVPPVHSLRTPLPALALPVPAGAPAGIGPGIGLSVTLGFGGFNTALALERGPGHAR
ncbi:beta-ketoacyl synthase N-terminal-like domain-containing protein [Streptomyces inusitatus]|uniref:beta-ketoacyl synthase N-terminal-like domain-containing protein n=1 Tax=Streptomyces inusitatus TaxID=68221 RepID=UPI001E41097B|nr:beta-ketoacyl synthase N-terminal-like domain-containing protein [Streptomyces inusitatus]